MTSTIRWLFIATTLLCATQIYGQHNPTILEDARVHPTSDGSFGFLYRTQDGIQHAAKGDPGGAVHGRFTYTDPTGLKVNFNYNAGAQAVKEAKKQPPQPQYQPAPQPQYREPEDDRQRYTQTQYEQDYQQPQPEYQPQQPRYNPPAQQYNPPAPAPRYNPPAPAPAPRYDAPAPRYSEPVQYRQPRPPVQNDIYDYDYNNRYSRQ